VPPNSCFWPAFSKRHVNFLSVEIVSVNVEPSSRFATDLPVSLAMSMAAGSTGSSLAVEPTSASGVAERIAAGIGPHCP